MSNLSELRLPDLQVEDRVCLVSVRQCNVRTQETLAIAIFIAMINTNVIIFLSTGDRT